jgi:uncharacterized protein YlzI (FlbEa/FlbD family)
MLIRLSHPQAEVYVNPNEISHIERETRPNTSLILNDEKKYMTIVSLKNSKILAVEETPDQIISLIGLMDQ